eukprot:gene7983-8181_t
MLATRAADSHTLAKGIIGDADMQPYGIVILFLAIAYISTSLDMTGVFAWLALHITRLSKGHGMALFLLYFSLSSIMTVFTSNDVCIMTLTPIIYYFAVATSADPIPFLSAQFTAANIWSMLLFVGNPTNIIVAMAYNLSFMEYSKWMALPTVAAGMSCLAVLLVVHARHIPKRLTLPEVEPAVMLVDKMGAVLGSVNILVCLGLLAAGPSLGWELWAITLVCAGLHAVYNFIAYVALRDSGAARAARCSSNNNNHNNGGDSSSERVSSNTNARVMGRPSGAALQYHYWTRITPLAAGQGCCTHQQEAAGDVSLPTEAAVSKPVPEPKWWSVWWRTLVPAGNAGPAESSAAADAQTTLGNLRLTTTPQPADAQIQGLPLPTAATNLSTCTTASTSSTIQQPEAAPSVDEVMRLLQPKEPSFWRILAVLPWEVVPFVLGMFVLVQGLSDNGWIDRMATWLGAGVAGSVWSALFAVGGLSLVLANIINNQPMTILMTRVCMSPAFLAASADAGSHAADGTPGSRSGAPFASALSVVVASNVAANFTVMGALAGIMFLNILKSRGMNRIGYLQFTKLMLPAGVASTVMALLLLGAEMQRRW